MTDYEDEKPHLDALVALLTAAGAHPVPFHEIPKADRDRSAVYTEVHVVRRLTSPTGRWGGIGPVGGWRAYTRAVGRDYLNTLEERRLARRALEEATLTVDGHQSAGIHQDTGDDPIGEDDGWWSGVSEWVYDIT